MNEITFIIPKQEDAQRYWNLLNALDHETEFMLYEPGERSENLSRLEALLADAQENPEFTLVLCAEHEGELIGFLSASRGALTRTAHSAYIVCGVREKFRHQGLGTKFFHLLDVWARQNRVHRLELSVVAENIPAINLYLKSGFTIEGTARHAFRLGGRYIDEYHMSKIYPEEP